MNTYMVKYRYHWGQEYGHAFQAENASKAEKMAKKLFRKVSILSVTLMGS